MTVATAPFLAVLDEANRIVRQQYPQAQFYEASRTLTVMGNPWRFVFNDPSTSPNSTVIIKWFGNEFGKPEHVDQPWLEDRVIPLPIKLDLSEAIKLAENAGYSGTITNQTLRWPLYPGSDQPYYILAMPDHGAWVFVGVNDRKVTTHPFGS
jgi:hypothetical protein